MATFLSMAFVIILTAVLVHFLERRLYKFQKTYTEQELANRVQSALSQAQAEFLEWNTRENAELAQKSQEALAVAVSKAREDSAKRAKTTVSGQIYETFTPFLPEWQWNPKDAHFIGYGIDFLVFDGLTEEKDDVSIYFIEVKTGKSRQNKREKFIEKAVLDGRVSYKVIRLSDKSMDGMGNEK